jgi:MYXO-CTERM domain-containing protein
VGTWTFHVAVADEAGNESQIDFDIEVGVDPPPDPAEGESCACRSGNVSGSAAAGWFGLPALALRRRRR